MDHHLYAPTASTRTFKLVDKKTGEEISLPARRKCWDGSEIMVRDQEEVLPCPWHGKTLGRLSEGKSISDIFFGEDFARLRQNMFKPEGDPGCAHCPIKSGHLPTDG